MMSLKNPHTSCKRATFVGCAVLCGQNGGQYPHDYPLTLFRFPPAQSARPTTLREPAVRPESTTLMSSSTPAPDTGSHSLFRLVGPASGEKGVTGKARLRLRRARAGTLYFNSSSQGISQDRSPMFVCGYPKVCVQGCIPADCDVRVVPVSLLLV